MRAIECIPESLWDNFENETLSVLKKLEIRGISIDSRTLQKGELFVAIEGAQYPSTYFLKEVSAKGAAGILLQRKENLIALRQSDSSSNEEENYNKIGLTPLLFTKIDPRFLIGPIANKIFPRKPSYLFAVTGTNGKTSVSFFIRDIMAYLGFPAAALGTIGIYIKKGVQESIGHKMSLTSPDAIFLHKALQDLHIAEGVEAVALEASSHGLHQGRLLGLTLSAAGFTNFTQDHLDYHPDMEAYFYAKSLLFNKLLDAEKPAILNADIPQYNALKEITEERNHKVISYGYKGETFRFKKIMPAQTGSHIEVDILSKPYTLFLPLIGEFQIYNAFCALGMVMGALEINTTSPLFSKMIEALQNVKAPPGRVEYVGVTPKGAAIYVDYAHTPDAFERVLKTLRPYAEGDVWILFGCGGDRDPYKRALMGEMASLYADHIVLTDDNPRSEDPEIIRQMIKDGIRDKLSKVMEIPDRYQALFKIIPALKKGDILLLAGKGHEEGQIMGKTLLPYNDKKAAAEVIEYLQK